MNATRFKNINVDRFCIPLQPFSVKNEKDTITNFNVPI